MYSQLIDEVVATTGRKDRIADIKTYANAVIRECSVLAYFFRDLTEDAIDITDNTSDSNSYVWNYPINFRQLRTVEYPGVAWPKNLPPGRVQEGASFYYYAATTYITYSGIRGLSQINVAYYQYPKPLKYYDNTVGNLYPAIYDEYVQTWTYLDTATQTYVDTLGTDALNEAAQALVSNWLLQYWKHAILEGLLTKTWAINGDERGKLSYSLYKSFQNDIKKGENFDSAGF